MQNLIKALELSKETHSESQKNAAGILGEKNVFDAINQLRRKISGPTVLIENIRFPKKDFSGKWEVDGVLVTKKTIFVLEIKTLGGRLDYLNASEWSQTSSRGEKRIFRDPIKATEEKTKTLHAYLAQQGLSLSSGVFETLVILSLDRIVLGPKLAKNSRLVPFPSLQDKILKMCERRSFKSLFIRDKKTIKNLNRVICTLKALPTWDEIQLNGGRTIKGDIYQTPTFFPNRSQIKSVRIFSPRYLALILLPSILWLFRGKRPARPSFFWQRLETITIQPAGQKDTESWPLAQISRVSYGYETHLNLNPHQKRSVGG